MLDIFKDFFLSVYGCFILAALGLGTLWCLSAYGTIGLLYPAVFVSACSVVLYHRERNRERAMIKADLQIDSEMQQKAIDDYLNLPSVKKRRKEKA